MSSNNSGWVVAAASPMLAGKLTVRSLTWPGTRILAWRTRSVQLNVTWIVIALPRVLAIEYTAGESSGLTHS